MILVDTSVLIDFFKGRDNAGVERFRSVLKQGIPFGITSCILQEILQGARNETEYELLKTYLETQLFLHPKDPVESYVEAAGIFFACRRKGVTVRSTIDCLIAQVAIENDCALLHNDRDFMEMARVIPLKFFH